VPTLKLMRCLTWIGLLVAVALLDSPSALLASACPAGLVIRQGAPGDLVCVTPESKKRVAAENARAPLLWVAGPDGPKTCANGYVWRQGFGMDVTCVTPDVRTKSLQENNNPRGDPRP
jgi:hypothetical protein